MTWRRLSAAAVDVAGGTGLAIATSVGRSQFIAAVNCMVFTAKCQILEEIRRQNVHTRKMPNCAKR